MPTRTTTSIVLLAVLVAGILTPTGMCALMCERHTRAESQRHCISSSDTMPGMVHEHSAMSHPAVEAMSLVMVSRSCVGDKVYVLEDHRPELDKFAGSHAMIRGRVNGNRITVDSAAKAEKKVRVAQPN